VTKRRSLQKNQKVLLRRNLSRRNLSIKTLLKTKRQKVMMETLRLLLLVKQMNLNPKPLRRKARKPRLRKLQLKFQPKNQKRLSKIYQ